MISRTGLLLLAAFLLAACSGTRHAVEPDGVVSDDSKAGPDTPVGMDTPVGKDIPCMPDCTDKECGADGCGGVCGVCRGGDCVEWMCEYSTPPPECDEDDYKCEGEKIVWCELDEDGVMAWSDPAACPGGKSCVEGQGCVCLPVCAGKECGDDGCGGVCGQCLFDAQCVAGACSDGTGCPTDLTDRTYRFTEFSMEYPTDKMNEVWAQDIWMGDLVVLLQVVSHDMPAGALTLLLGSGSATAEMEDGLPVFSAFAFAFDPSEVAAHIDADCNIVIEQPTMLLLATPNVNKPLAIDVLSVVAVLSPDGTKIPAGNLHGAIHEGGIFDFCLAIPGLGTVNLHWFFNLAGICPSEDLDGDGVPDAYYVEAYFAAEATDLFVPGIQPIGPLVGVCPFDDKSCE